MPNPLMRSSSSIPRPNHFHHTYSQSSEQGHTPQRRVPPFQNIGCLYPSIFFPFCSAFFLQLEVAQQLLEAQLVPACVVVNSGHLVAIEVHQQNTRLLSFFGDFHELFQCLFELAELSEVEIGTRDIVLASSYERAVLSLFLRNQCLFLAVVFESILQVTPSP
jgi:hypothetical protein